MIDFTENRYHEYAENKAEGTFSLTFPTLIDTVSKSVFLKFCFIQRKGLF